MSGPLQAISHCHICNKWLFIFWKIGLSLCQIFAKCSREVGLEETWDVTKVTRYTVDKTHLTELSYKILRSIATFPTLCFPLINKAWDVMQAHEARVYPIENCHSLNVVITPLQQVDISISARAKNEKGRKSFVSIKQNF